MKNFNRRLRIIDILIALTFTVEVLFLSVFLLHLFRIAPFAF